MFLPSPEKQHLSEIGMQSNLEATWSMDETMKAIQFAVGET
jgi:hypothetical protein